MEETWDKREVYLVEDKTNLDREQTGMGCLLGHEFAPCHLHIVHSVHESLAISIFQGLTFLKQVTCEFPFFHFGVCLISLAEAVKFQKLKSASSFKTEVLGFLP